MAVNDLDARIKELKNASLQAANFKKEGKEQVAEIRERKYHGEMQFEKAKLEQKLKYEMQIEENQNLNNKEQSINVKLPETCNYKVQWNAHRLAAILELIQGGDRLADERVAHYQVLVSYGAIGAES